MAKRSREPFSKEDKRKLDKDGFKKLAGIFHFMLPYKGFFILGSICLALSGLLLLAFPYFAGMLLDVASAKSNPYFGSINQVALVLLAILFVQSIFSFLRVYSFSLTSERALSDLRQSLFKKLVWSPLSFFDNSRVGELMSRITSDVALLQDALIVQRQEEPEVYTPVVPLADQVHRDTSISPGLPPGNGAGFQELNNAISDEFVHIQLNGWCCCLRIHDSMI